MNRLSRSYYRAEFAYRFHAFTGTSFQDWFAGLMERRYPGDFLRVRPWGKIGDRKNDGYLASQRTLFQVYAPREMSAAEAVRKIDEDFNGALPHWEKYFDKWIFVHNDRDGLGPDVAKKLISLDTAHAKIKVGEWGFSSLEAEVLELPPHDLLDLFGPAPTDLEMHQVGMEDIQGVLEQVEAHPAPAAQDMRPVSSRKLAYNMLSDDVSELLRAGMRRSELVRRYFTGQRSPTKHDEIAASFRQRYAELREQETVADNIFHGLRQFVGGTGLHVPKRDATILAVLAFFFEECEIFERPPAEDEE